MCPAPVDRRSRSRGLHRARRSPLLAYPLQQCGRMSEGRSLGLPIAVALLASLVATTAHATPDTITFAARLDTNGVPLTGPHVFEFSIWDAPTGGFSPWGESLAGVPVDDGRVAVELGTI